MDMQTGRWTSCQEFDETKSIASHSLVENIALALVFLYSLGEAGKQEDNKPTLVRGPPISTVKTCEMSASEILQ